MTRLIYGDQMVLFGTPRVVGVGRGDMTVTETTRDHANAVIVANHYSRKFYNNSTAHLSIAIDGQECGVMQFGQAMNPASGGSVVAGTTIDEYLELNRMWLSDAAPRNSESRALSLAVTYLRHARPSVGWVQSFADERCGRLGVVYQAAGFGYYGEHTATFWEVGGVLYHNSVMTRDPSLTAMAGPIQQARAEGRAVRHEFRQFRYLRFLRPAFRGRCLLTARPFPKPAVEVSRETRGATSAEGVGRFHPTALLATNLATSDRMEPTEEDAA